MVGVVDDERLRGWKEIAEFLHASERTVQRWERFGLPIDRVAAAKRAIVFADRTELLKWTQSAEGRAARGVGPSVPTTDALSSDAGVLEERAARTADAPRPDRRGRWHSPLFATRLALVLLALLFTMGVPFLPRRAWVGTEAPEVVGRRAAASSNAEPHDSGAIATEMQAVCSGHHTLMLGLTLADNSEVRIGVTVGAEATYTFGGHFPMTVTVSCREEKVLLAMFQANGEIAARRRQLQELATVAVAPGGRADVPPGLPFKQVWWLRTLPPPAPSQPN